MAIKQIVEIPHDLPPARLFLDDIEELTTIFIEAVKGTALYKLAHDAAKSVEQSVEPRVRYEVGGNLCDSIDDLKRIGDTHNEFVIDGDNFRVRLSRFDSTWDLYGADREEKWNLYGRVQAIFENRRLKFRNLFRVIPFWLNGVLFYAFAFLPPWVLVPLNKLHLVGYGIGALIAYYAVFILVFYKTFSHHSVVDFRYYHEAATARARWKAWEPYLLLLVGALAYALAERVIKALWP